MNLLPGLNASPFSLLVLWAVLFIILADVCCPAFYAYYACPSCCGRGR